MAIQVGDRVCVLNGEAAFGRDLLKEGEVVTVVETRLTPSGQTVVAMCRDGETTEHFLPSTSVGMPRPHSFDDQFLFDIGDRVVVEVTGTIKVRQENEFGLKYIIQPDNPRAAAVHSSPEYVFPADGSDEPGAGAEVAEIDDAVAA